LLLEKQLNRKEWKQRMPIDPFFQMKENENWKDRITTV